MLFSVFRLGGYIFLALETLDLSGVGEANIFIQNLTFPAGGLKGLNNRTQVLISWELYFGPSQLDKWEKTFQLLEAKKREDLYKFVEPPVGPSALEKWEKTFQELDQKDGELMGLPKRGYQNQYLKPIVDFLCFAIFFLSGTEGFEPPSVGTKNRCLTTWRYPNNTLVLAELVLSTLTLGFAILTLVIFFSFAESIISNYSN